MRSVLPTLSVLKVLPLAISLSFLSVGALEVVSADGAYAQNSSYAWTRSSRNRRARGYQGYVGGGPNPFFCSYWREPRRVCQTDRRGRRRCRISGWRIHQQCS